jgi:hypothetical protein
MPVTLPDSADERPRRSNNPRARDRFVAYSPPDNTPLYDRTPYEKACIAQLDAEDVERELGAELHTTPTLR